MEVAIYITLWEHGSNLRNLQKRIHGLCVKQASILRKKLLLEIYANSKTLEFRKSRFLPSQRSCPENKKRSLEEAVSGRKEKGQKEAYFSRQRGGGGSSKNTLSRTAFFH
jgi:hypothetical protein